MEPSVGENDFERRIFINCPFDDEYRPLLMAAIFAVQYMGLYPMLALDSQDSGQVRFDKILKLIQSCRFGIHDLSRCTAQKEGEFYRLNMPLELGLDLGARYCGTRKLRRKRCLVLETERFRYQKALSDIGGSDIRAHQDSADEIIKIIREWIVSEAKPVWVPPPSEIIARYEDFTAAEHERMTSLGWNTDEVTRIPIPEFKSNSASWMRSCRSSADTSESAIRSGIPQGIKIKGRRGHVLSPHSPESGLVDVHGIKSRTVVKCPYSGGLFQIP